jgi:predicted GNAT family N-acyltransferase
MIKTEFYEKITPEARIIREQVFIKEQGFKKEFDEIDEKATHIVIYGEDNQPIATCRVFEGKNKHEYILGRLAVNKEYRGKNMGSYIIKEAEKYVQEKGGTCIILHSQCRVKEFYNKLGYEEFGKIEDDEGCPHIWMKKDFLMTKI